MSAKKLIFAMLVLIGLFKLYDIVYPAHKEATPPIVYFTDEKAIREVLSKEKSIEQFSFNDTGYIAISRRNIKEDNSGFCEYICLSISQYIGAPIYVRAVDHYAMLKKEYKEIGKARCTPAKQETKHE